MSKRLLVMAGGTGGHVFPGLAVAKELKAQGWDVHWLGTSERLEAKLVPDAGFSISFIDVVGVRGNGIARLIKAPFQIIKAVFQARGVMKRFKPDVVLGMGGFASGPGGIAAWMLGIPLLLHEQNAVPGLTNRVLARFANRVLTGFDQTFEEQSGIDAKYQWVGNPVRSEFYNLGDKPPHPLPLNILVVGGSLGAKVLNEEVPKALGQFEHFFVRHQTGDGHASSVEQAYRDAAISEDKWQVQSFINDMADAYKWADLVICRAGALTVAEVAASGTAAVFVPLPHAVDDHQTKNARVLSDAQAAYLLPQNVLTDNGLVPVLKNVFADPQGLLEMGKKAKQAGQDECFAGCGRHLH